MNKKMRDACLAVADVFEFAPECWTTGSYALNGAGGTVWGDDPSACKWCSFGGLQAVVGYKKYDAIGGTLGRVARTLGYDNALDANDKGGRLVAIKMLRMAGGQE